MATGKIIKLPDPYPTYANYVDISSVAQGGTFTVPKTGFYSAYVTSNDSSVKMIAMIRNSGNFTICRLEAVQGGAVTNLCYMEAGKNYTFTTKINVGVAFLYY